MYQNPHDAVYTHSEKTDRKYTVGFAVSSAERRLRQNRRFRGGICMNAVGRRDLKERITLQEVNKIAEQIVGDSLYYDNSSYSTGR